MGSDSGDRSVELAMKIGSDFRPPSELDENGKTKKEIADRIDLVLKQNAGTAEKGCPFEN